VIMVADEASLLQAVQGLRIACAGESDFSYHGSRRVLCPSGAAEV
jgi:hypothetical protein